MAQQRLPMRKIRDVLRLSAAGLSKRQIAASLGIGPTAAGACLRRAREAGISWPLPDDLGDDALERRLYPAPVAATKDWRSLPDWPAVHRELRRKGVTLQLVWEEYRATHPDGYGRSWFCELYRAWEGRLSPTMRQAHVAGEKLFVDYAGTTSTFLTRRPARCVPANCSSQRLVPQVTPTPRRRPRSRCLTGS